MRWFVLSCGIALGRARGVTTRWEAVRCDGGQKRSAGTILLPDSLSPYADVWYQCTPPFPIVVRSILLIPAFLSSSACVFGTTLAALCYAMFCTDVGCVLRSAMLLRDVLY